LLIGSRLRIFFGVTRHEGANAVNLAQRLLKAGALPPEQLSQALHRQKKFRGFLAHHLIALDLMEPEALAQFVSPYPPKL
jgi:hypothetical protein